MKKVLFSACIVLLCSTFTWAAIGLPASTDKATTDEPIVKIIKIGDKESGCAPKCGKTCGRRPSDKLSLGGDVFVVKSDPCAGCDKKGTKECSQQCGKDNTARCPVTGAQGNVKCDDKCSGKCDGKCNCKNCKCDGKCDGKCAAKCGKGKPGCCPVTGACSGKPTKTVESKEIVLNLSDIPGHEGLDLGEFAEVSVVVYSDDDEGPLKLYQGHGKRTCDKTECRAYKCSKDKCGKAPCCGDCRCGDKGNCCHCDGQGPCHQGKCGQKAHGCKGRCDGHCQGQCQGQCKGDCRGDCHGQMGCHGGDVRGMIVIMINQDGSYTVKTVGDCSMGGGCPMMKAMHPGCGHHGQRYGDRHRGMKADGCHCGGHGPCHKGNAAQGCSGKCHGEPAAHCGNAPKCERSCKDKCDREPKAGKMKHGKKAKCKKTMHRGASCGEI